MKLLSACKESREVEVAAADLVFGSVAECMCARSEAELEVEGSLRDNRSVEEAGQHADAVTLLMSNV